MPIFFGKRRPDDDEVVWRGTVPGICTSRQCAGNYRQATKTVFGNGDIWYTCLTCGARGSFAERDDPAFRSTRPTGREGDEPPDRRGNDPANKRGGRKR